MLSLGKLFHLFFIAIVTDFITGIINAGKQGKLKSRTCSDGMFRTLGELIVLVIFITVSYYVPDLANYVSVFILGFILKECISIMENLVGLGVELPTILVQTLNAWHEKVDTEGIKKD